jgi:hypothetical protein
MSEIAERLTFNGQKYATPELAERARRDAEAAATRATDAVARRAADFERRLRDRYLATGATEQEWETRKRDLLAAAREKAALESTDVARSANRGRYTG